MKAKRTLAIFMATLGLLALSGCSGTTGTTGGPKSEIDSEVESLDQTMESINPEDYNPSTLSDVE